MRPTLQLANNESEFLQLSQQYFLSHCAHQLQCISQECHAVNADIRHGHKITHQAMSLCINASQLLQRHPTLFLLILTQPRLAFKLLDISCLNALLAHHEANFQHQSSSSSSQAPEDVSLPTPMPILRVRLTHWPMLVHLLRKKLPHAPDVGKFILLKVTVMSVGDRRLTLHRVREFVCDKCFRSAFVEANVELAYAHRLNCKEAALMPCSQDDCYGKLTEPDNIQPSDGAPLTVTLDNGKTIQSTRRVSTQRCFQEIRVQEQVGSRATASYKCVPQCMIVYLEDDLVNSVQPGEDILLSAIVCCQWRATMRVGDPCLGKIVLLANYIHTLSAVSEKEEGRIDQMLSRVLEKSFSDPLPRAMPKSFGISEEMELELDAFRRFCLDHPMRGRNVVLRQICPQLFGLYIVKLAVALMLAGSVPRKDSRGLRTRAEPHILLVGDPGTAKSQFLKFCVQLLNSDGIIGHSCNGGLGRAVLSSGTGSSRAGLTAIAVRESSSSSAGGGSSGSDASGGSQWTVEAGALVLADGGLCCIDEFNCLRESDRVSLHEAMEQQSVSVAKAGLCVRLQSRCSVLATCNPKSGNRYDPEKNLCENIGVGSPLLSRFDLVLFLLDEGLTEWDNCVTQHVLRAAIGAAMSPPVQKKQKAPTQMEEESWSLAKVKAFFTFIRWKYRPVLSEEAVEVLRSYYSCQRSAGPNRQSSRTTMRLLESSIRLSVAHARLMMRNQVTVMDAVVVLSLMESAVVNSYLFHQDDNCKAQIEGNVLHVLFPDDPEKEYRQQEVVILQKLQLTHLMASGQGRKGEVTSGSTMNVLHCSNSLEQENLPQPVLSSTRVKLQPNKADIRGSQKEEQRPALSPVNPFQLSDCEDFDVDV